MIKTKGKERCAGALAIPVLLKNHAWGYSSRPILGKVGAQLGGPGWAIRNGWCLAPPWRGRWVPAPQKPVLGPVFLLLPVTLSKAG